MSSIAIKHVLLDAGVSQADIAKGLRVSRQYINHIISGTRRCPQMRAKVAAFVGRPVAELWPDDPIDSPSVDKYTSDDEALPGSVSP